MSLQETIRHTLARYTVSVLMVAAASSARVTALGILGTGSPYLTFYPAVMIAALYGGLGPGALATILSAIIASWWIPPIGHPLAVHTLSDWLGMGIFVLSCAMISVVCAALRRAKSKELRESLNALKAAKLVAEQARAEAEAEAANKAKDHFLAVLSHELRTPLTPVLAVAQTMERDGSLSAHVREQAEIIRRNVELEARLIDDLLDLTRISRGKLELHLGTADVHKYLKQVIQICDSDIRSRKLQLVVELQARAHHLQADGARLQQVFWNLLRNSVKFTPVGGTITLRTANCEPGGLSITVHDTGIGMDPAVLPRIFNAFEQAGPETTRIYGGLGLGLSISKALVEMHGGTLVAASPGKGHGSTFTIVFPDATHVPEVQAPESPAEVGLSHGERAALMNYRILLVEDHPDSAKAMARLLKAMGYEVRIANCVAAALQSASAESFHMVISDIGLPDGSGLDLMRQLKLKGLTKGIAVSGFGMEEDIVRSRDAGFTNHLTKPINMQQFEAAVSSVLEAPEELLLAQAK